MKPRHPLVSVLLCGSLVAAAAGVSPPPTRSVEIFRDPWGIPHVFAATEPDGFFGVGYATAEDRLLQMELFRRRATGRLAEVFGAAWIDSDRKFRIAGLPSYCQEAAQNLPDAERAMLGAYAAGVNAFVAVNPVTVRTRFARLPVLPEPWTDGDCICAWMAVAEVFDRLYDESAVESYVEFQRLVAELGEPEALKRRGMMIDDAAAVVPESEMAKNTAAYAALKARPPTPGFWRRSLADDQLRFSHAWAVGGSRSATGKPLLESDPQTAVSNPPLWYEYHLSAGRFDVRGIGVAGSPGMLIGFNRRLAWGASALGASATVTFLEQSTRDRRGYLYRGESLPFERRTETIAVRDGAPVHQEVSRTRHGFVFNDLVATRSASGDLYVSHRAEIEQRRTSVQAQLGMMAARNWTEFRDASQDYYSPGLHVVYADVDGAIAYETLVHVPLTRRTPRMALEGWTGADEVTGRIPLDELPHMVNPSAGFISHANNLPIGSWYPHDLGIGTGGTGHTARSLRLVELLSPPQRAFSVASFERDVHRDDVHAAVAALLPVAQRVVEDLRLTEPPVTALLQQVRGWDFRYQSSRPSYAAAQALAGSLLLPYRRSNLGARLGGGEGGITHLARLLKQQYGESVATPSDPEVREYLLTWLRTAAETWQRSAPARGGSIEVHRMPYQENGPLRLPSIDSQLDLTSPPLACGQVSTIWSQPGNSYTQIVDLADPDNSRSLLPPGVSEDPGSPFHTDQMALWVAGTTHPAPLSRDRIEAIAVSRLRLKLGYLASGSAATVVEYPRPVSR